MFLHDIKGNCMASSSKHDKPLINDFHIWQPFEANEMSSTIWVWQARGVKTKVTWQTKSVLENAFVKIDER
jgi:hypothetical protein